MSIEYENNFNIFESMGARKEYGGAERIYTLEDGIIFFYYFHFVRPIIQFL